VKTEYFRHLL